MQIENNMVVAIHYTLTLEDGKVMDSSAGREPLNFIVGHHQIINGLENALMGLKVGDKKNVVVDPKAGYGERDEALEESVPLDKIPADIELKKGLVLHANQENGEVMEFPVKSFDDKNVVFDLNHPLAGETLTFETEIMEVRKATDEEIAHGHVH